jgi:4-aminobutyrate aminotransferase-like enzyme
MTKSQKVLQLLRDYESPNVTFMERDGSWPIVWERAKGCDVWDVEGKKYLDLTAAFGVAAAGHANLRVVRAGQKQMGKLLHAMGDVHPHACKANLARELSRLTFERWSRRKQRGKTIFCNSGFEAVEAALKTARIATGRSDIIAFEGAYHGLGYGALNATHRNHFREPFRNQLREFAHFVPFPIRGGPGAGLKALAKQIRNIFESGYIGAILLEPIQVRGGVNIPPPGLLPLLRQICDEHRALLIFDEIYTGLGRTGKWFACEHFGTVPDIICIGKALTGGFPLSACVGEAELMDTAWPVSTGEAIHTSTFLGHPVGCAMALAQIEEIKKRKLVERSAKQGKTLLKLLRKNIATSDLQIEARGLGLLACVELRNIDSGPATEITLAAIKTMLARGLILLPEGEHANVISFTPPLTISERQLAAAVQELARILGKKTTPALGRQKREFSPR